MAAWFSRVQCSLSTNSVQAAPGGLGESVAKLVLSCMTEEDGGVYECRAQAAGQEVVVATKLDIVGHKPLSPCIPRSLQGAAPAADGRVRLEGTDLVISQASWADMGRFTCTAQNGFGVDLASTFLYPLAPAFY